MSTVNKVMALDPETAIELLYRMKRLRMIEEVIAERYPEGKMRCPTHLSIGQEAAAAVSGLLLQPQDLAVSTHRAHAHYLAKGGDLQALIAELYGKATGCSRGKGGSMHLTDPGAGFIGSTAIVSSTIPVGAGLGLALQLQCSGAIACIYLGDGAVEEGVFYETLNFASLRRLPVLFVCENNRYSVYSPLSVRQPAGRCIYELAEAIGIPARHAGSVDVTDLYGIMDDAINGVRRERAPRFVEIETHRWREHCGPNYDDELGYRPPDEIEHWLDNDPLALFQERLLRESVVSAMRITSMESAITAEIEAAFEFAEHSEFPPASETCTQVYADSAWEGIPWTEN